LPSISAFVSGDPLAEVLPGTAAFVETLYIRLAIDDYVLCEI